VWRSVAETFAVFAKDVRTEFRTRVALNALGLFAITVLVAIAYAIGPYRIAEQDKPFVMAVFLWVILFFAALAGLDRSFVKEEETHTAPLLRLSAHPLVVWAGKLIFNLLLIYVLMVMVTPLFCVLMAYRIELVPAFLVVLVAGGFTLAVTTTIVAAIISRAMTRGALFSVLALPLLLPLLIFLIQGTAGAAEGAAESVQSAIRAVVSLGGILTVTSVVLFPAVWND
jgi:heme exporter protein B